MSVRYLRSYRVMSVLSLTGALTAFAAVFYLQYGQGLEPCPLCVLQRLPMLGILLFSALGVLTAGWRVFWRRFLAALCLLMAAMGLGIAGRHLWLQQLPDDQVPSCGPGLDVLLEMMPPFEALQAVLAGDGSCAEVQWSLLGLTIPGWSAVAFAGLGLIWLFQLTANSRDYIRPGHRTKNQPVSAASDSGGTSSS